MSFNSTCTLAIGTGSLDESSTVLAVTLSAVAAFFMTLYLLLVCSSRDWLASHHLEGDAECPRCVHGSMRAAVATPSFKPTVNLELI